MPLIPKRLAVLIATLVVPFSAMAAPSGDSAEKQAASPNVAPGSSALVARGKYLADVAHCTACHTADNGPAFGGSRPMGTPFGTLYTSNITSDPVNGIGKWSEKDFEGALRRGVKKDGSYIYPAMPYIEFTKITDDDIHALYAYFRTIAPVAQPVHKNEMKFPFNVRLGIAGWQGMFFRQGRYVPDRSQSAEWNRGAYLVQSLGHCEACHSPTNLAMAPKKGQALQGNVVDHWFAPDISGGQFSSIKNWNEQQIVTLLRTGHNDKNQAVVGPMQETVDLGTSKLSDIDLQGIAVYLKNQPTQTADKLPRKGETLTAGEIAHGKALFMENCQSCHGPNGQGLAGIAPSLVGAASTNGKQPETALRALLQGFEPSGQWGVMPSFSAVFTPEELADVTNYIRHSWGNAGSGTVTSSQVTRLAKYSDLADPTVESALVCPSAPTTALDQTTIDQVKQLGDASQLQAQTNTLVQGYRSRHPKIGNTEIITAISGAYCRTVMATSKGTLAQKQQQYVAFTGNIAQALSGAK